MQLLVFLLLLLASSAGAARAEEIRLEACDVLPLVQVSVSGAKFLFLVDTAATSVLNLKSFAHGAALRLPVTSWSGTVETSAERITIGDLSVGSRHLRNLKLPAVDLSAIGRACGRQLGGILGIDLLRDLGATVDLGEHAARLILNSDNEHIRMAEVDQRVVSCQKELNSGDESAFADCLDSRVVVSTSTGDFNGREAVMEFFRQYLRQLPRAQVTITLQTRHFLGEAIWVEYELRASISGRVVVQRGSALCQKTDGRWRAVLLSLSSPPGASAESGN